jgi:carboxymethylenebutenolidase
MRTSERILGDSQRERAIAAVGGRYTGRALLCVSLLAAGCAGRIHMPGYVHAVEESELSFESLGRSVRVDAFVPEGRGSRYPAAIVLHGSSGIHLMGGSGAQRYAEALAQRGIAAYVVHYFDGTDTFSADDETEAREYWRWVRVVKDAVGWVRARPEVRPGRVGLLGVSLGAYVAVGAAATDPRVSRVVLVSGGLEPGIADSVRRFPPTLLLHGTADDEVPVAAEDTLTLLLAQHHVPLAVHRYPGEGHDLGDQAAVDMVDRSARFLAVGPVGSMLEVLRRADTRLVPPGDTARARIP